MKTNTVTSSDGKMTIVLTDEEGDVTLINESHPNFTRILDCIANEVDFTDWLTGSTEWFHSVYAEYDDADNDFYVDIDGDYYVDGVDDDDFEPAPVIESLSDTIERYRREGRDATNLVHFMRRLAKNPSRRSRDQLFTWTQAKDLTIDLDGYLIGYKGVTEEMLSIYSGTAYVDGEPFTGQIPNAIGTVVSMPRYEVQDDPTIGCSYGLHVGSWSYASSWGSLLLEVRIDPADVVSVPTDSGFQKLRCCEYEIVAIHETDVDDLTTHEPDATYDDSEALDAFVDVVPAGFLANLRARLSRKGKS